MPSDLYDKVYIDFDADGSFATAGDDVSAYWQATHIKAGIRDADRKRVADVGTLTLTMANEDKRFSPDYTGGPYYGKLAPGLPLRVDDQDDTVLFRGIITSITPEMGTRGPFTCQIEAHDFMGVLQGTGIGLPLQEDEDAEILCEKISAIAFDGAAASASATFDDTITDGDTVTIGAVIYTFKTSLTPYVNEILIDSGNGNDNLENVSANLAAALNGDAGESTTYGDGTVAHQYVTGTPTVGFGVTSDKRDLWIPLRDTGSAYDELSATWYFQDDEHANQYTKLFMRKVGSPTGTMTITIEYSAEFAPSGTLIDASATTTVDESTLAAGGDWVEIDWGAELEYVTWRRFHLHLTTDRAASAVNYVELGADNGASAFGLIRAKSGGTWSSLFHDPVILCPSSIALNANARGAWGNSLALATTGSNITVGGAAFSGGTDAPSGLQSFTSGDLTFPIAADEWTEERTNGARALDDVASSAHGFAYTQRNGTITFQPYTYEFEQLAAAVGLDLTGDPNMLKLGMDLDNVINEVVVEYIPRREGSTGVIARANGPIKVPAQTGTLRYNPTAALGVTTQQLTMIEGETGNVIGAKTVITPVATTDYTVLTGEDASTEGATTSITIKPVRDLTSLGQITMSVAKKGGALEVTIRNRMQREVYIHNLQIRGTALIAYDRQQIIARDETSIAAYGRRTRRIRLPLPSDERFAEAVANWELYRLKNPRTITSDIRFDNQRAVNGTNLFSLGLMDTITITETQTGISDHAYLITGWSCQRSIEGTHYLSWQVQRLNDTPTWILGDATYSVLGSTTKLGL